MDGNTRGTSAEGKVVRRGDQASSPLRNRVTNWGAIAANWRPEMSLEKELRLDDFAGEHVIRRVFSESKVVESVRPHFVSSADELSEVAPRRRRDVFRTFVQLCGHGIHMLAEPTRAVVLGYVRPSSRHGEDCASSRLLENWSSVLDRIDEAVVEAEKKG